MKIKKESNYLEIQDLNIEWEEFKKFFEFLKTDKIWCDFKIINCYDSYHKIIFNIDKEELETELWHINPMTWKWYVDISIIDERELKKELWNIKQPTEKRYLNIEDVLLKQIWQDTMASLLKKYFSNQPYIIDSDITIIGV